MKFIGITGGVGCGKSIILDRLFNRCNCIILEADALAKEFMAPDGSAFLPITEAFADYDVFNRNDDDVIVSINNSKMADVVFHNDDMRRILNGIVHPLVKEEVLARVAYCRQYSNIDYFFFEAALIIEEGYDKLCDEVWYVFAPEDIRRQRLKRLRNYSDERIDRMFEIQLPEEVFRSKATHVIENIGDIEQALQQAEALIQ